MSFIVQPGNRRFLRRSLKVNYSELGKPDKPHTHKLWNGISAIRKREGLAGRGCCKKRKPLGNRVDRGYYNERMIYSRGYPI